MQDAIDMGRLLHDSPDLLPWVIFVLVCIIAYKERDLIRELFTSLVSSRKETALYHAQHNELVRNNTAALENNTAMLSILKQDRRDMVSIIGQHEQLSMERMERIQDAIDETDKVIREVQQNVALIADRTDTRR